MPVPSRPLGTSAALRPAADASSKLRCSDASEGWAPGSAPASAAALLRWCAAPVAVSSLPAASSIPSASACRASASAASRRSTAAVAAAAAASVCAFPRVTAAASASAL